MRSTWALRALFAVLVLVLAGWVVHKTRWVEVEVDNPVRGEAATDRFYSLRKVLQAAGSTLEVRTALEPLPPTGATLVLNSSMWTVFPERDARLQAWVRNGGHLVVHGIQINGSDDRPELKWLPLSFPAAPERPKATAASAAAAASVPASEASAAGDDEDGENPSPPSRRQRKGQQPGKRRWGVNECPLFRETDATTAPAYEPGRIFRSCQFSGPVRAQRQAPTWVLSQVGHDRQTLAVRVPYGRGTVTGVPVWTQFDNRELLRGDDALVTAAILQAAPGRAVWLVTDEAREPFALWLWHETRTPLLLCSAAIALALWRLMVRFGPLQAQPPRARRSMGEQVRGTGQFIAGSDMAALHAATRRAFDDAARLRVEGWHERADDDRVPALAAALAPAFVLDERALREALHPGPNSTPAQWRAAIRVLEQSRRTLLHAPRPDTPDTP